MENACCSKYILSIPAGFGSKPGGGGGRALKRSPPGKHSDWTEYQGCPYCRLRRLGIQWEGDLGVTLMLFPSLFWGSESGISVHGHKLWDTSSNSRVVESQPAAGFFVFCFLNLSFPVCKIISLPP